MVSPAKEKENLCLKIASIANIEFLYYNIINSSRKNIKKEIFEIKSKYGTLFSSFCINAEHTANPLKNSKTSYRKHLFHVVRVLCGSVNRIMNLGYIYIQSKEYYELLNSPITFQLLYFFKYLISFFTGLFLYS